MAGQWAAPMGRLSRIDERPDDCAGQTDRDQTGRSGRDLETDDGEVPTSGGTEGGKGRLRDSPTGQWSESRERGRNE